MRITADDIKQIQLFKYYRIVRKWMCKANNLKNADLELLIYLDAIEKQQLYINDFLPKE